MPGAVLEQGSLPLPPASRSPSRAYFLSLHGGRAGCAMLWPRVSPHRWQDPVEMPWGSPLAWGRSRCRASPAPSAQVRNHSVAGDSARAPGDAQIPAGMEPGVGAHLPALQLLQCLSRPFRELSFSGCPCHGASLPRLVGKLGSNRAREKPAAATGLCRGSLQRDSLTPQPRLSALPFLCCLYCKERLLLLPRTRFPKPAVGPLNI